MEATKLDQNVDLWQTRRDEADAAAAAAAAAGAAAEAGAAEAGAGPLSADAAEPGVVDTSDERKHKLEAQAARANDGLDMFAEQVPPQFFSVLADSSTEHSLKRAVICKSVVQGGKRETFAFLRG